MNLSVPRLRPHVSRRLLLVLAANLIVGLWCVSITVASTGTMPAETDRENQANYELANKFSSRFINQYVYSSSVTPGWIGESDVFWYRYRRADGWHYNLVHCEDATKSPLFDHADMAANLSILLRKPIDTATLDLGNLTFKDDGTSFRFEREDRVFEYVLADESLREISKEELEAERAEARRMAEEERKRREEEERRKNNGDEDDDDRDEDEQDDDGGSDDDQAADDDDNLDTSYRNYAPDKSCYVFMIDYNLYFAEEGKEEEAIQLTDDGEENYTFSSRRPRSRGQQQQRQRQQQQRRGQSEAGSEESNEPRKTYVNVTWSEDSKYFHATRRDSRGVAELFLVNSLSEPRPTLETYAYPMPGEDAVRRSELYVFRVDDRELDMVEPKWRDERYSSLKWGAEPGLLRMMRTARTLRNLEYCELNIETGEATVLIEESIEGGNLASQGPRYIRDEQEIIWWSERTGWGHFYRYDRDGNLLNAITTGPSRFSRIVDIDEEKGLMWVRGNAREPGENVYFDHLYRVFLDGTGLMLLDAGNANHRSSLSPSKKYIVDNCSRVDMAPASYLRDESGKVILELEQMDLSRLEQTGWKMPETFVVKAADGVTDLYGNMWKPFDFDPAKSYPIILHVYPGPQTEGVTHTFSATGGGRQQLAQLGFIVVQVGHRGGTPGRSKAYHSYGYYNLRDYPLADKKAAIEQLAQMHPYIDIDRVGIYGHSGGGFLSAAALLRPPYNDFFKVGVASAGNHDNNVYNNTWSERYHGLKEVKVEQKKDDDKEDNGNSDGDDDVHNMTDDQFRQRMTELRERLEEDDLSDEQREQIRSEMRRLFTERTFGGGDRDQKDDDKQTDQDKKENDETKFEIHIPTNHELAENLKGHLLLVHGDMDNNVHPAGTIRLVNALIKANKRFDFMIFPGKRHGFGDMQGYFTQMMWEYFAEHLMGDRQTSADMNVKQ